MKLPLLLASGCLLFSLQAGAAILFTDTFEAETLSLNASLSKWNITEGTVDVVGPTFFSITCADSSTRCVDLDGSTSNGGRIETKDVFSLSPLNTYVLTYFLSGSQRSGTNSVTVSLGSVSVSHTLESSAPMQQFSLSLSPFDAATSRIVFDHAGGDNVGLILDNVQLEELSGDPIPEPSTMLLSSAALVALAWLRGRR